MDIGAASKRDQPTNGMDRALFYFMAVPIDSTQDCFGVAFEGTTTITVMSGPIPSPQIIYLNFYSFL